MAGFVESLISVGFLCGLKLPDGWREKLRMSIWAMAPEQNCEENYEHDREMTESSAQCKGTDVRIKINLSKQVFG